MEKLLEMANISKVFPGVQALKDVSFTINKGEVVALVGANGAGKSTLLKIISGVYSRDAGEVKMEGVPVRFATPADGKKAGIATIYQELTVIPNLTIAENIFISEISHRRFMNYKSINERTQRILDDLELDLKPKTKVGTLSVANQQMVEIARAINENAKVLIMDEPTSALTFDEKNKLFKIVKSLRDKGIGLVFVSHRMNEVMEISDRVTVLRDGMLVGHYSMNELSEEKLVELMIGRNLASFFPKKHVQIGEVVLRVENLRSGDKVKNVSFDLRKGEILGITGLMGAGRTEVARCIFGIDKPDSGTIYYKDKVISPKSPKEATALGFALVPEDRKKQGLVLQMSVAQNIILGSNVLKLKRNIKHECEIADKYINSLNIKCYSRMQKVLNLSGGNQQKVVIAKWLLRNADVLILDEPTRGIDVEAKAEVHNLIGMMVERGAAVVLISSEFDEIMGLCDRAVVLYEGNLIGVVDRKDFSEDVIMTMSHGKQVAAG